MVLGREENLCSGDMLMVVKNNYYWTEKEKDSPLSFIANGDRAIVQRVRGVRSMYGFMFADVWLRFLRIGERLAQCQRLLNLGESLLLHQRHFSGRQTLQADAEVLLQLVFQFGEVAAAQDLGVHISVAVQP